MSCELSLSLSGLRGFSYYDVSDACDITAPPGVQLSKRVSANAQRIGMARSVAIELDDI